MALRPRESPDTPHGEQAGVHGGDQPLAPAREGVNKVITRATETGRNAPSACPPIKRGLRAFSHLHRDAPKLRTGAFNPKVAGSIPARPITKVLLIGNSRADMQRHSRPGCTAGAPVRLLERHVDGARPGGRRWSRRRGPASPASCSGCDIGSAYCARVRWSAARAAASPCAQRRGEEFPHG
jgi:hypothetical protein